MPTETAIPRQRPPTWSARAVPSTELLMLPGDEGYDEARIWNGAIDRRPGKLDHAEQRGEHHGTG
jgi:hypothetical protein